MRRKGKKMSDEIENDKSFAWLKKHVDTMVVLGGILAAVLWINGEFTTVRWEISSLRTDMAVMKTVLIMQKIMPQEICKIEKEKAD
jgi:hypothetical protein